MGSEETKIRLSAADAADEKHNQQQLMVAGLHRDGEQARIVEAIRRRQIQQYENQYTFEYVWGSVLYYSGFADEHPSLTFQCDDAQNNFGETENLQQNATVDRKQKSIPQPANEGQMHEKAVEQLLAKRPYVVRLMFKLFRHIHLMLRWFIDVCITRLSRIESLPRSLSSYATNPSYSMQFQVDDMICFIVVLCTSLWISSKSSNTLSLIVIMICVVIGSVGTRVVERIGPSAEQLQSHPLNHINSARAHNQRQTTSTRIQPVDDPRVDSSKSIERLQKRHPNATKAECIRFFKCTKLNEKAASARIDEWFAWRLENGLPLSLDDATDNDLNEETIPHGHDYMKADEQIWNESAQIALQILSKGVTSSNLQLPQIICSYEMHQPSGGTNDNDSTNATPRCRDGTRIFHLLPARCDLSIATAQVYALVAALYLDRLLSRSTTEKVSLICDVRGGRGWANPTPWSLLPFVQATSSLLGRHFPERLKRMVLYPMPSSAVWVWAAAQKFLDADTASKVVVVGLDVKVKASDNNDVHQELEKFITKGNYLLLEERRRSFFSSENS